MMGFAGILWSGIKNCHLFNSNSAGIQQANNVKETQGEKEIKVWFILHLIAL